MRYLTNASDLNRAAWERFVTEHPHGTIFQSPAMFDLFQAAPNYIPVLVAAVEGEEIRGLVLGGIFSEQKALVGLLTRRAMIAAGPLLTPGVDAAALLGQYDSLVRRKAVYTNIANSFDVREELGSIEPLGYRFEQHLNFHVDLSVGEEILWKNLHPTRRKQVTRGKNRGLTVAVSDKVADMREYYDLLKITYDAAGLPLFPYEYFDAAHRVLSPMGKLMFFSVLDEGRLVGHRIELLYKDRIYDWWAGAHPDAFSKYPNDVLVWEVLHWGAANGFRIFDFGGAGHPDVPYGVREFKKKFGGDLVNYGIYQKIHQPLRYNLLKSGKKFYQQLRSKKKAETQPAAPAEKESAEAKAE